jgi:molybdenum cofactor biosynthesis enzyme MoaA
MALTSIGVFIGTGKCNANCKHCAGRPHRKYAPIVDGSDDFSRISDVLLHCYLCDAKKLSITGSGEPTLSPLSITRLLDTVNNLKERNVHYRKINLYTNGITIGNDAAYCNQYLPNWRRHGLKTIYLTVHSLDSSRNAEIYRVKQYPRLQTIIDRVHQAGLKLRANIVLSKDNIATQADLEQLICGLGQLGADSAAAWPIRNKRDDIDYASAPPKNELTKMLTWAKEYRTGRPFDITIQTGENLTHATKTKLTLFPDGQLTDKWCTTR